MSKSIVSVLLSYTCTYGFPPYNISCLLQACQQENDDVSKTINIGNAKPTVWSTEKKDTKNPDIHVTYNSTVDKTTKSV